MLATELVSILLALIQSFSRQLGIEWTVGEQISEDLKDSRAFALPNVVPSLLSGPASFEVSNHMSFGNVTASIRGLCQDRIAAFRRARDL